MAVTMEIIRLREKDDSIPMPAMVTLIYPTLQMANYQLPSYQQNQPFMFYPSLIPKFFLSYIGYEKVVGFAACAQSARKLSGFSTKKIKKKTLKNVFKN